MALKITRPSGHLQGTLNLSVQLVENSINRTGNENGEQALFLFNSLPDVELTDEDDDDDFQDQDKNPGPEMYTRPKDTDPRPEMDNSRSDSVSQTPESKYTNMPGSEHETNASFFSTIKPLPSEVADDLKRGVYATEGTDYGSSVFENWTEKGDNQSDLNIENVQWPEILKEDLVPLVVMSDKKSECRSWMKQTENVKKKKGLLSCFFGNAYGFEFNIICGSGDLKKKQRMMKIKMNSRNVNKQNVHLMTMPQDDLRKFYV